MLWAIIVAAKEYISLDIKTTFPSGSLKRSEPTPIKLYFSKQYTSEKSLSFSVAQAVRWKNEESVTLWVVESDTQWFPGLKAYYEQQDFDQIKRSAEYESIMILLREESRLNTVLRGKSIVVKERNPHLVSRREHLCWGANILHNECWLQLLPNMASSKLWEPCF